MEKPNTIPSKKLVLSIIIYLMIICTSQSQNLEWAKSAGGINNDSPNSICSDISDNVYVTGSFTDTIHFGGIQLVSNGNTDIFIAKYNYLGNIIWAKTIGGPASEDGISIVCDDSNYIYITGAFSDTVDFDPSQDTSYLTSAGDQDVFILKMNVLGDFIWAKNVGGYLQDRGQSIAIDKLLNIYVAGYFRGTADFDPGIATHSLSVKGNSDIFILKLNTNGNFIWVKSFGSSDWDNCHSIAVDDSMNVMTTGEVKGADVDYDPGPGVHNLPIFGVNDIFVSKLDSSGNFKWAHRIGSTYDDDAQSVVSDKNGNIYIAGNYSGTADFNPGSAVYNLTGSGAFILKLSSNGNFIWAKGINGNIYTFNMCLDINNNIYTTGRIMSSVDVDPGSGVYTLSSNGLTDVYILKLNQNSGFEWATSFGGTNYDLAYCLSVNDLFDVLVAGIYKGTGNFDPNSNNYNYTSVGGNDIFVVKFHTPIAVSSNPVSKTVSIKDTVLFTVVAEGKNINYQWQKNGTNISGYSNDTLIIYSAQISDIGDYRCIVSNNNESDTSHNAHLNVLTLDSGLVAYYPFSGNAADSSGNGNNGINYGATLSNDRFGNSNKAFSFNGSSSWVYINGQIIPSNGSFSISLWVKPSTISGIQEFISQNTWPGAFYVGINGNIRVGDCWQNTGINPSANVWQHLVINRNYGSNAQLYLNGTLVATSSQDLCLIGTATDPTIFGKAYIGANSEYYNGVLDDIRIYNRPLSQYEINQLYFQNEWEPFTEMTGISLAGVQNSTSSWIDFDNDNDLDILLTGVNSSSRLSKIYKNDGSNTFSEHTTTNFPGVSSYNSSCADFNNDGFLDVLISGFDGTSRISKLYKNNGNNIFQEQTNISLSGFGEGTSDWGDYDNDGDLDLLITGSITDNPVVASTKIYKNDRGISLQEQTNINILGIRGGTAKWGDYDNDGDLDILITGYTGSQLISKIYKNNGASTGSGWSFTESGISLSGVTNGSAIWGDYDCDGDLDILISGSNSGNYSSKVYKNNGNGTFTHITAFTISGIDDCSIHWGDYDNDGDLDILMSGENGTTEITRIYRNDSSSAFTEVTSINLLGVYNAASCFGDYDNDGDLDILLTGTSGTNSISKIYRNNSTTINIAPTAPSNLQSSVVGTNVTLTWNKSTDAQTLQNGLSYNIYIYLDSHNLTAPHSNTNTGWRKVAKTGPIQWSSSGYTLKNLIPGTYKWKVQAIDAGLKGGSFSVEDSFDISDVTYGLLAYYPFTGNPADSSGKGNHGTNYGATLTNDRFGHTNRAYNFDGQNDYINIPYSQMLAPDTFSICAWVKINGTGGNNQHIISTSYNSSGVYKGYCMQWINSDWAYTQNIPISNSFSYWLANTNTDNHLIYSNALQNNWYFLVGTFDGTSQKLFVNGNLISSSLFSLTKSGTDIRIGAMPSLINYFNGVIDDVRIYDRVLTQTEINLLYGNFNYPNIANQPTNISAPIQDTVSFIVQAIGDSLVYQWQKDSVNIIGATNDTLIIYGVQTSDIGNYRCIVSNVFGADTSIAAYLNVLPPPTITSFFPSIGSVGTLVTITGTNLGSPSSFSIGGKDAIVVSSSDTTLVGLVMPGAVTGTVSVTTSGGTTTGSSNFTVIPTPCPSTQQGSKLVGTGAIGTAIQGRSVSISADGNTAIVGGRSDNGSVGAVWFYTRSSTVWSQQGSKLVGTGAIGNAEQGTSVSISADGNTAIVGGANDNTNAGAAWIYTRSSGVWSQQGSKLVGTGAIGSSRQGSSVSISADGNTAIVGGFGDNTWVGAAWVYTRSSGVWLQQGSKLVGTGAIGNANQGYSVSISADGNTAIVGGFGDNSYIGAAWVYTRSSGVWSQQGSKLVGTGAIGNAYQGRSVSISADGNTSIIGGIVDNSNVGAAWVYTRSSGVWSQQGSKLVGTGAIGNANQGRSVSISADGNTAIVGGETDNSNTGAAWVYTRSSGVWSQQGSKLVGSGAIGGANQGYSVSISADGNTAIMGGYCDNSFAGAAWVFVPDPNPSITSHPQSQTKSAGDTAIFIVAALGDSLSYQWQKDGINITGATNDTLSIFGAQTSNVGSYRCIVSNVHGADTSNAALLNVIVFSDQPTISMIGIKEGAIDLGDYDNDGYIDVILTGYDNSSGFHTKIYKNNGDNTFTLKSSLTGIYNSSVKWGDYDNDGDLDILLSGFKNQSPNRISKIYKNNGNNSFSELTNVSLPGYNYSSVAWGDYDNDGDLDILLTGMDVNYNSFSKIFKNLGNDNFVEQSGISLAGVSYSSVAWVDYDNDGDLDILLSGSSSPSSITKIYRNNGDDSFTVQSSIQFAGVRRGSIDWGDYNNDGNLDLLLTGILSYYPYSKTSKVYKNNGNNTFTEQTNIVLPGIYDGDAKWGDYDNDGDLDILLSGLNNSNNRISKVYTNSGNNTFTELVGQSLIQVGKSSAAWVDYDNDGDLDILLTGQRTTNPYDISKIYRNNLNNTNQNPTSPANLISNIIGDTIIHFQWSPSIDDLTSTNSITYNLRIGSTFNGIDIKSPMSDLQSGKYLLAQTAMVQDTFWTMKIDSNISQHSKIYWDVQAIDQNFNASLFSITDSFLISYHYSETDSICNGISLAWHGKTISQAGVYYDSLITINGSDSIYEITVSVLPSYFYLNIDSICSGSSVSWRGNTISQTGVYYDSLTAINGCDSIYQLTLTVNPTYFYAEADAICDNGSLSWHGQVLIQTGVYYDSLLSINGCDSVYQLTLTVNPTYFYAETDTICDNGSLLWHGSTLTTAGVYYDSLLSSNGCDSVYQLTLLE